MVPNPDPYAREIIVTVCVDNSLKEKGKKIC
jgi:hypothetical protein